MARCEVETGYATTTVEEPDIPDPMPASPPPRHRRHYVVIALSFSFCKKHVCFFHAHAQPSVLPVQDTEQAPTNVLRH